MKTLQNLITAKENWETIEIKLFNGKIMIVDFNNNCIMRYVDGKGVEFTRDFYCDKPKMYKLALTYLKKQLKN